MAARAIEIFYKAALLPELNADWPAPPRSMAAFALAPGREAPQAKWNLDPLEHLDSHHYEHRAAIRDFERSPEQRFDRVAFAMKVLGLLRMPHIRVAVFSSRRLVVESGRELGSNPDARWAMVGVPADASARSIVLALSDIMRTDGEAHRLHVAWAAAEMMERRN